MTPDKFNFYKQIISLIFLISPIYVNAQKDIDFSYLKDKYPAADVVRLNSELHVDISLQNDEIVIEQSLLTRDLFLTEAATQYSKSSVSHSSFYQLEKIEASSFNLKNGKYI